MLAYVLVALMVLMVSLSVVRGVRFGGVVVFCIAVVDGDDVAACCYDIGVIDCSVGSGDGGGVVASCGCVNDECACAGGVVVVDAAAGVGGGSLDVDIDVVVIGSC